MNNANELVDEAVGIKLLDPLPARVRDIVERHRQSLLDLASALLAAGRDVDEVVQIIQKASESFSIRLDEETKGQQS